MSMRDTKDSPPATLPAPLAGFCIFDTRSDTPARRRRALLNKLKMVWVFVDSAGRFVRREEVGP